MLENSLINISELSFYLNISKQTVYQNYKNWGIPYNKFGGIIRFNTQDIENWLKENKQVNNNSNNKENTECHKRFTNPKIAKTTITTSQLQGNATGGQLLQAISKKRKSLQVS